MQSPKGVMPPRGGNPGLSDWEVTAAVVYMANQSGASFKEPPQPAAAAAQAAAPAPAAAPVQVAAAAAPAPAATATPPAAPAAAPAAAGVDALLQKSGCLACHAVDKKVLGPSYQEVAAKYAGDKNAAAALVQKVKAGGVGVWGQIPMPPHPQLSDADLNTMVTSILAVK
jgi:cytochrome c